MDVVYIGGETLDPAARYKHKADVLRATPYAAFSGNEGVIGAGDLKVVEGDVPDAYVNINPGVVAVLGRGQAQSYEMYVAKAETQESVDVPATDSSGPRSDLIIVRVVDPEDGPSGDTPPTDTVNGPYAFPERIHDVDPSTTSLEDTFATHGVRAGYALARIDLPTSTGTVTTSEIVPLRSLANPRKDYHQESKRHSSTTLTQPYTTSRVLFPSDNGTFFIDVPKWATRADIRLEVSQPVTYAASGPANLWGNNEIFVNDSNVVGFSEWNNDWNGGVERIQMTAFANAFDVTPHQGTQIKIESTVYFQGGGDELREDNGTNTFIQVYFTEEAI